MARRFKVQIPADAHSLAQLLAKLGMVPGPMKSVKLAKDGRIDIWFVAARGTADIKRVSARLVRGVAEVSQGSPRRVYLDVRVQNHAGEWRNLGDADYTSAGLQPPHEYDGESWVDLDGDVARGETNWSDMPAGTQEVITYFRFLSGDRDRAISEAKARIEAFKRGE